MLTTGNSRFEIELKKRIAEEIERLKDVLAFGAAVKDYAEHRYYVGRINALTNVADEYCSDVQTKIDKG